MGWWNGNPKQGLDEHEEAHRRACKGEGIPYRIVDRKGIPVIEGNPAHGKRGSRQGAIALYAGFMAGGGDSGPDRKAAMKLAKEAGLSEAEVRKAARKYV